MSIHFSYTEELWSRKNAIRKRNQKIREMQNKLRAQEYSKCQKNVTFKQ